jgi:hypothetical protein
MPFQMGGGREGHMEEPIYMPHAARPLSPVASYQPGHFPHDAYYSQQQYATIDKGGRYRGERKHKANGKSAKQQSSDSNAEDSEYGGPAGIYKKGHINERAFAHSMKNEHRSRSYGSLANLQFDPAGEELGGLDGSPEMLNGRRGKEHEMQHMIGQMDGMDLDDDQIVRREVPAGFFPPAARHRGPEPPAPGLVVGPGPVRRRR